MGSTASASTQFPQQRVYQQSSNLVFLDKLKSALAINKRKNKLFDSVMTYGPYSYRPVKYGTYKTVGETPQKVDYETVGVIGKGSFGVVYAGKNEYGQLIAVKCKKALADQELMEKSKLLFEDELEALYNLNHPNILRLLGFELNGSDPVSLVMEYIVGETLDKIIRSYRSLSENMIQSVTKQMVDAVSYMHSKYVMHRDLKSSNIMIVSQRYVKLIDFGMAKHFDYSDRSVADYNMSSATVVGTVPYMAPELILFGRYNSKIDIWGIGVITYEMNNGNVFVRSPRSPYAVDTIPLNQYHGAINLPRLSPIANNFIQACLTKNSDVRPTASHLLMHPFLRNVQNPAIPSYAYSVYYPLMAYY